MKVKRGDFVKTDPKSFSYKVWRGVVLQVMPDGVWAKVYCTEPDDPSSGTRIQWIPLPELEVVNEDR